MQIVPAIPASDFKQVSSWKNSDPLSISNLKGSIILIDFWTYTCIFCLRTLPLMTLLNNKYSKYGLKVIQAHSAEYEFARTIENVENALSYYKLDRIPVAIDNQNKTWEAYGDSYWPKHVLIDHNGFVRYEHAGYGRINDFEIQVRELLEEAGNTISEPCEENEPHDEIYDIYGMQFDGIAPETCVGYSRLRKFGNKHKMKPNALNTAIDQGEHLENVVYLRGSWIWEREGVRASTKGDATASIMMRYNAASKVHAIIGTTDGTDSTIMIHLDGKPVEKDQLGRNVVLVDGSSLCIVNHPLIYNLINTQTTGSHEIEIVASSDKTIVYTFVFG